MTPVQALSFSEPSAADAAAASPAGPSLPVLPTASRVWARWAPRRRPSAAHAPLAGLPGHAQPNRRNPAASTPVSASAALPAARAPLDASAHSDGSRAQAPLAAPIVDLRQRLPWRRRLPARLGTTALWVGSLSLLGPLKLAGLLAASACVLPGVFALDALRRQRSDALQPRQPAAAALPWPLPRAELAERFYVAETVLSQARHARICTVVIDPEGRLTEVRLPASAALLVPHATPLPAVA